MKLYTWGQPHPRARRVLLELPSYWGMETVEDLTREVYHAGTPQRVTDTMSVPSE